MAKSLYLMLFTQVAFGTPMRVYQTFSNHVYRSCASHKDEEDVSLCLQKFKNDNRKELAKLFGGLQQEGYLDQGSSEEMQKQYLIEFEEIY